MGSTKIQGGMTSAERQALLKQEEKMAREREDFQRERLANEEDQRQAREKAQRMMAEQEEAARTQEIQRMEAEAAGVVEDAVSEEEVDTAVSDMFAALAMGTEFISDDEFEDEEEEAS